MATVLFGGTLAVLIAVAAFGMIRVGSQGVEAMGYLPLRWGENNMDMLVYLSLGVSLPLVVLFVLWFFKRAVKSEAALVGYRYSPPSK
jgi:hypothetical protein